MASVGIKELKDHLSDYLRRVVRGEEILITDRGRPVAHLSAAEETPEVGRAWALVRQGKATWGGGKPRGTARPPRPRGKGLAEMVLEDRR